MSGPSDVTYNLATLQDFWALPDADVMERAFKEISLGMVQLRRYQELIVAAAEHLAEKDGKELPEHKFTIPDSIDWIDDGGKYIRVGVAGLADMEMKLGPDFHGASE